MKKTIFVFVISLLISVCIQAEEVESIRAREIWTINDTGVFPYLSPDGSMVAWEKKGKVYISRIGTEKVVELGTTKELLGWLPESNEYVVVAEGFISIKTKQLVISTKKTEKKHILKMASLDSYGPYVNPPSIQLKPLWILENGTIRKVYSSGEPYNFALFQDWKNNKIILFSNGVPLVEKNSSYIFDFFASPAQDKYVLRFAFGSIVILPGENRTYTLPTGSRLSWSPDNKKLIFAVLKDDGHKEISGDLFLCNWDGTDIREIKFETTRIRRAPSFGPPNMITYMFLDENYNPCIGVAELIFPE